MPDGFPAEVARRGGARPCGPRACRPYDATDIPFFTIDPPASTDLDQAMHLSRRATGGGYRVHYAIADVAAFVAPGGALDAEAHRRVTTLYFPDGKVPLHPPVLSEGAASLLPDQTCPAVLWRSTSTRTAGPSPTDVRRALVRSRAKLDYAGVQQQIDAGTAEEPLALLEDIGRLREDLELARGGISLERPRAGDRRARRHVRPRLPRPAPRRRLERPDLPPHRHGRGRPDARARHRHPAHPARPPRTARSAGCAAPPRPCASTGRTTSRTRELVRSLDPHDGRTTRPSSRSARPCCAAPATPPSDDGDLPDLAVHAAVAAPYAHCTAPLRRLVDRYASELCLAAAAGTGAAGVGPGGARRAPQGDGRGHAAAPNTVERECVDLVEAALLKDRVGEVFDGVVVDVQGARTHRRHGPLWSPRRSSAGSRAARLPLPLGERLRVRLTQADPASKVLFAPA